jgi:hypothetical protein
MIACTHIRPTQVEPSSSESEAEILPTDTVQISEGHVDFSRYTTPDVCERAVMNMTVKTWRRGERDTLRYDPEHDTLPTAARITGQQCVGNFTVKSVDPTQLFYLVRLYLALGRDPDAETAIAHRIALAPDITAKGNVLFESINTYLEAKPSRPAAAEALMQQLDALGHEARIARLRAHHALLSYWALLFDIPRMEREADSIIAVGETLTEEELETWGALLQASYLHRASIATFKDSPKAAVDILQQGITALGKIRGGQPRLMLRMTMQGYSIQANLFKQPAPQLTGHYWFNSGDSTTRPSYGKVSLLVQVNANCGEFCYRLYAILNRLHQQYGAAGFEITLVARTLGYSPNSGVQTPVEERESIRKYFMEDRKLPAALVVQESSFITQEDGRRVNQPTQYDQLYNSSPAVLVDREGLIRWMGQIDGSREAMINAYIVKLLDSR